MGVIALVTVSSPVSTATTNDPLRPKQWGLNQIHAEAAWQTSTGTGAVVAVVDTGVDLTHPDLAGQLVAGTTFAGCPAGQRPCSDGNFKGPDRQNNGDEHGTHVAGIIAAATNNGTGIAGVAPDARIMPVKVLEGGSGSYEDIADDVICVAATDRNELKSYYSELPVKPDLKAVAAPGGAGLVSCDDDIWSTVPTGTGSAKCGQSAYDAYAGTSMATPHVAGVAALLFAQGRNVNQVETALLTTARQPVLGVRGVYTPVYGYGIVDAQAAVAS